MIAPRTTAGLATVLLVCLALAGCGSESNPGSGPVTAKSLAAVVADHAGKPRSSKPYESDEFRGDAVGTEVSYPRAGTVDLAVGAHLVGGVPTCKRPPPFASECAEVDGALLLWATEEPEEDPGIIYLYLEKDSVTVSLSYSGPTIGGDPRKQDLPIGVDTLIDIVQDPRVR